MGCFPSYAHVNNCDSVLMWSFYLLYYSLRHKKVAYVKSRLSTSKEQKKLQSHLHPDFFAWLDDGGALILLLASAPPFPWCVPSGDCGTSRVGLVKPVIIRLSNDVLESLLVASIWPRWLLGVAAANNLKYFSCSRLEEASPPLEVPAKRKDKQEALNKYMIYFPTELLSTNVDGCMYNPYPGRLKHWTFFTAITSHFIRTAFQIHFDAFSISFWHLFISPKGIHRMACKRYQTAMKGRRI